MDEETMRGKLSEEDRRLDALLAARVPLAPSRDFAERVIRAARSVEQRRPADIFAWIGALFAECRLPRPVYAFASVLAAGFALGLSMAPSGTPPAGAPFYIQDYLYDGADL